MRSNKLTIAISSFAIVAVTLCGVTVAVDGASAKNTVKQAPATKITTASQPKVAVKEKPPIKTAQTVGKAPKVAAPGYKPPSTPGYKPATPGYKPPVTPGYKAPGYAAPGYRR